MTTYFGNSDPSVGLKHHANDDFDGDGLTNLQEYRAGMDPTDPTSAQRVSLINPGTVQWQAKPYELYELLGSTNLSTWTRVGNPILPTNATPTVTGIATNSAMFFRVLTVP